MNSLSRLSLRSLLQNRLRTALTILGIALGVAILLAINLANEMALSNFRDSLDRVAGKSNLTIQPAQQDLMDEQWLAKIQWLWLSDGRFTPVIQQTAVWPGETPEVVQVLGVDLLADQDFRSYDWESVETEPAGGLDIFLPDRVLIGETLAATHGLKPGESFTLLVNDAERRFVVSGILSGRGVGGAYGGSLVMMDIATLQRQYGLRGRISRIDVIVPDAIRDRVQAALARDLPSSLMVQKPARRGEQVGKMLRAYQYNLTALSFIALLVGVFLIYNTMSIAIIRRRPEIGTLRAIGVSQGRIFKLFLMEAFWMGLLGTLLGLVLGVGMSRLAVGAVAETVANLYTGQVDAGFSVNPVRVLQAFGFGIVMTMLGALAPVLEATSVAPAEAVRRAAYESRIGSMAGRLTWIGALFTLIALWAYYQPPVWDFPVFGFVSALATILAATAFLPWLLRVTLAALTPILKQVLQTEGRLAALMLKGALARTAVAVASLMIGIAMMVSLAVMIGSFRETVIAWVNQTLEADLWVDPASKFGSKQTGRIQPETVARIRELPQIAAVDTFYEFPITYNGNPTNLGIGEFQVLAEYGQLLFMGERSQAEILQQTLDHPAVVVTESFARRNNVWGGDSVTLQTPTGEQAFAVEGVYYDYASDLGYIVMPRQWYERFYQDQTVSNLAVYLKPGVAPQAARQAILGSLGADSRLIVRSNVELKQEVLRVFDRTFAITYALHIIAIAVALLAVMNALFAMVLEARRDFGILKYLGAGERQIGKIILVEAGLLGLFGNLAGLAVGFVLSLLLIYVINRQSFGWTIQFEVPWPFLLQSFLLVMVTALLSGLIPARLAARTPAPEVVKSE